MHLYSKLYATLLGIKRTIMNQMVTFIKFAFFAIVIIQTVIHYYECYKVCGQCRVEAVFEMLRFEFHYPVIMLGG